MTEIERHTSYVCASSSSPTARLISPIAFTPMIPLIARLVIFACDSPSAEILTNADKYISFMHKQEIYWFNGIKALFTR